MPRRSPMMRTISRTAHQVSRAAGDIDAYQAGGPARLGKRVARRRITRSSAIGGALLRLFSR